MADPGAATNTSSSSSSLQARIMNQQQNSWRAYQTLGGGGGGGGGYPGLHTALAQGNIHGHLSKGAQGVHMPAPNASSVPSVGPEDFQETKSITLEWKLSNLKTIFDSSRGDVKSRCIKSPPFGDGKWEIYFYGNSGSDYVSLYLSAEPTAEERERGLKFAARSRSYTAAMLAKSASNPALAAAAAAAVAANKHAQQSIQQPSSSPFSSSAAVSQQQQQQQQHYHSSSSSGNNATSPTQSHTPWVREGSYRFAFEVRSTNKKEGPIKMMEAADHVFSSEARNWGWQSFARRVDVYYNNMAVRHADAFVISCTITHTPSKPAPAPQAVVQKRFMPLELVNAFAGMFDDPTYSDVKFVIRSRSPVTGQKKDKSLYAIRKILSSRAEYFETMFSSGFAEDKNMTSSDGEPLSRRSSMRFKDANSSLMGHEDSDMDSEDSDDLMVMYDSASEGEEEGIFEEDDEDVDGHDTTRIDKDKDDGLDMSDDDEEEDRESHTAHTTINEDVEVAPSTGMEIFATPTSSSVPNRNTDEMKVDHLPSGAMSLPASPSRRYPTRRSGRASLADPSAESTMTSTMRSVSTNMPPTPGSHTSPRSQRYQKRNESRPTGKTTPSKQHRDDRTNSAKSCVTVVVKDASYSTYKALLYFLYTDTITFAPLSSIYSHAKDTAEAHNKPFTYKTRRQFFDAYIAAVYGPSSPYHSRPKDLICSSKAIYKLADKLNMPELKARAFEHMVQSLTIETIPYEVFSAFSDQFPEVRKVQIDMMLHYWNEVREGQAMKNVLRLIRLEPDRFPGYEDVWQHLLMNLEYRGNSHTAGTSASPVKETAA